MSHFIFIVVCCIWGTSFLLMKRSLLSFEFISVGAGRVIFGALVLGLFWLLQRQRWPFRLKDLGPLVLLAGVGYCVPFCMQPYVVGKVQAAAGHGSAFAGMLVCLVPLLTVAVSIPMLKVYPTKRQMVGLVGGLAFLVFLFANELKHGVPIACLLLGAISPLCYATANAYIKRRFQQAQPLALSLMALLLTAMILTPLSIAVETIKVNEAFWTALGALAILGVICTGIATFLFYKLIHQRGPLFAGMVAYIIPCLAIVVGWLDNEQINSGQLAAIPGVFVMVGLVQYKPPRDSAEAMTPESVEL